MQLDMFSTPDFKAINSEIQKYRDSSDKVRRGVFAKVDEVKKMVSKQQIDIDLLKSMLSDFMGENKIVAFEQKMI